MATLIPPHIKLLTAMKTAIAAVDFVAQCGINAAMRVDHGRNRNPTRQEKPSMLIIFVSDDPVKAENDINAWETNREMVVDLQCDLDLATELSGSDPTGLLYLSLCLAASVTAMKHPTDPIFLGGKCDWISVGSIDPEDRSQPDHGRMTRALTVLYRVRSDEANVLLAAGENG